MATIQKRGSKYRVFVCVQGVRKQATCATKAEAQEWAKAVEAEIRYAKTGKIPLGMTFGDLLLRYADEVSVGKKTGDKEVQRIERAIREEKICAVKLTDLDASDVAAWRDSRRKQISDASVRREWNFMSHACTVAVKEWKWLHNNPFKDVTRPATPEARDRRFEGDELERLLVGLGCDATQIPHTPSARVGFAVLFAIETAMRCGEICALEWRDILPKKAIVRGEEIGAGKSGRREVPLSREAQRLLSLLPSGLREDDGEDDTAKVFELTPVQVDALFRKGRTKAMIDNIHFHDTRAEALTRMAGKVPVLTLAKISGHRDLKILLNTYYRENMDDVAAMLG